MPMKKLSCLLFVFAGPLFLQTESSTPPQSSDQSVPQAPQQDAPQSSDKRGKDQQKLPDEIVLEGGATVAVNSFVIQGNQQVQTEQLQRLLSPYLNRSLSQSDIFEIRNRIQLVYQVKGLEKPNVIISGTSRSTSLMVTIVEPQQESNKFK